ncbi:FGGY family carbohydrate kinase [Streptomyces sp. NPDC059255]|uniref:FGGY family carbohydrate kinase n=1 Tax=Streptomyces sp. NPDC059255 TaxID=3346793 RepID=UPI0036AD4B3B
MTVLAIDQGTSGTKALVVDPADGVVAVAEVPVTPVHLPGGGVEQDPEQLLASVLEAGRRAVDQAGGRPLRAVALANQGETVLAWDRRTGRPLSQAVVWQDRRSEALCAERADAKEWVARRTGLVLDPYFSAPKMTWLRENVTRDGVVTTTDTWLVHQLTGAFVTDASTASRSLLLGIDAVDWDPELTALFGLDGEELPRIVACDETVGTTDAFGGQRLPLAGLIVDQQAALFAEGCLTPGTAKCTYGTGAFLLAHTGDTALRSASGLTSSVAWRARGGTPYCVDGQVYTAASAVRWLQDLGFVADAADLDQVAASDAAGVLCIPALAGLAAPWWRPDATASLTGMTLSTRREHLVTAVLQGIAAQVAEVTGLVAADLGAPLTRLRADGGLTRCATLMQAQADLARMPVDVYSSPHATALGAAAMARLAIEPGLTLEQAVPEWTPGTTYEPRWSEDRAQDFRARWLAAVDATAPPRPAGGTV